MNNKRLIHNVLIVVPVVLIGIGMMMIWSASCMCAAQKFNDSAYFLKKQALFAAVGLLCMLWLKKLPYRYFGYKKIAYAVWIISMMLLVAVLIPGIGAKVGGASRWIRIGPISFQPSEFAKLAVIILLAYSFAKKEHRIKDFSIGVLPHLIIVLPIIGLVFLQPDFGMAVIFLMLLFAFLFAAGVPRKHLASLCLIGTAGLLPMLFYKGAYRIERLFAFLDPWGNYQGTGYHIVQSLYAFGSGGVWGKGLAQGTQKLFYLPEPHTDFIMAVIAEEFGLFGIIIIIVLFMAVLYCGLQVAMNASDLFGTYLALGIIFLIGLQAIINMGVVMGIMPTKGTTLPFISYGGSSLVINLLGIGLLIAISEQSDYRVRQ